MLSPTQIFNRLSNEFQNGKIPMTYEGSIAGHKLRNIFQIETKDTHARVVLTLTKNTETRNNAVTLNVDGRAIKLTSKQPIDKKERAIVYMQELLSEKIDHPRINDIIERISRTSRPTPAPSAP